MRPLAWRSPSRSARSGRPGSGPASPGERRKPLRPEFQDYFSEESAGYAAFRPRYPAELFAWLASIAPGRALAWDAGTGSGQAAVGLAAHFDRVIATDGSAQQLARAEPHPRVEYRLAVAGQSGLAPGSVDLVTVAQALHWFDRTAFYREVRQALRPAGVIAAWTYGLAQGESAIEAAVADFALRVLAPWWPADRRHVDDLYRHLDFPFDEVAAAPTDPAAPFAMETRWTMSQLLGFVGTWSALRRCRRASGRDPLPQLEVALARSWGDPAQPRAFRWPLGLRVGRVPAGARTTVWPATA